MKSKFIDMPVGLTKVKRAEATLLGRSPVDLAALDRSELAECAWALATVVTAAQQGVRLDREVFMLAESIAYSRNRARFPQFGPGGQDGATVGAYDDQDALPPTLPAPSAGFANTAGTPPPAVPRFR